MVTIYCSVFTLVGLCFHRSAKLIPEDDQIFTDVELNLLEKVINETTVGNVSLYYDAYAFLRKQP